MALAPSGEWLMPREGGYRASCRSVSKARTSSPGHDSRCGSNMGANAAKDPARKGALQGWRRMAFAVRPQVLRASLLEVLPPSHRCTFERREQRRATAKLVQSAGHVKHRTTQDRRRDIPTHNGVAGKKVSCGSECAVLLVLPSPDKPYPPPRGSIDLVNAQKGGACGCGG